MQPAPAVYFRRPSGSVNDVPNQLHLTAIRDLNQPFNVAGDLVRLDWLDDRAADGVTVVPQAQWKRWTLFGLTTTVPGEGTLAGYAPSVIAPGWWADCFKSGLMHPGTPYQQDCFIPTGNGLPLWWSGTLQTINRTLNPHASLGCCVHEGWDTDSHTPGVQVGNGSYGCVVIMPPPDARYRLFGVIRNTIRTLLQRRGQTTFGLALIEVHADDPLLSPA